MAAKTISGAYPAGYYLDPAYDTLIIAGTATVGGAGVTTTTTQPTTVNNRGSVQGDQNGITLSGGGTINNGSSSYPTAEISGYLPILVQNGAGVVRNWGTISSTYNQYYTGPSIVLENGGSVSNVTADSLIGTGITISGAAGTVVNRGTIGHGVMSDGAHADYELTSVLLLQGGSVNNGANGVVSARIDAGVWINGGPGQVINNGEIGGASGSYFSNPGFADKGTRFSVTLKAGGTVTNGTASNTAAVLENGVSISGASGTVVNIGSIGGAYSWHRDQNYDIGGITVDSREGPSVELLAGGSVTNGSSQHTNAALSQGISIAGGAGSVSNFGSIGAVHSEHQYSYHSFEESSESFSYSVVMSGGGTVTNGTTASRTASISNGISISGGVGTVHNHGTIGGPTSSYSDSNGNSGSSTGFSVLLKGGGTVTNGDATDAAASLTNGVSLQGAAGTVINFGVIGSNSDGVAVSFDNAGDVLVQQGTGVLDGKVSGGGGTLVLAGDAGEGTIGGIGTTITGFSTIRVEAGASWNLTGAVGAPGLLANHGTLTSSGVIDLGTTGQIANQLDGTLFLVGNVGVVSAAGATKFGLVNSGLLQKASGAGTSIIGTSAASTGQIVVASGKLEFAGKQTRIAGAISGAGTVWFGPGDATLKDGSKITTGGLQIGGNGAHVTVTTTLAYAGTFSQTAATELSVEGGDIFTLRGATTLTGATIDGAGRLATSGATAASLVTLGGTASWVNYGTVTETGKLTLGDASGGATMLLNGAGGTFNLAGNVGIAAGNAADATLVNRGTLAKTAGTGKSSIAVDITNLGTIEAQTGTLELQDAVMGTGGTLELDPTTTLELDSSVSAGQTVLFEGSGGATLLLNDPHGFHGTVAGFEGGDTIDLGHYNAGGAQPVYTENAGGTGGTLSIGSGANQVNLTLVGDYEASLFHAGGDGHGGTAITYGLVQSDAADLLSLAHS